MWFYPPNSDRSEALIAEFTHRLTHWDTGIPGNVAIFIFKADFVWMLGSEGHARLKMHTHLEVLFWHSRWRPARPAANTFCNVTFFLITFFSVAAHIFGTTLFVALGLLFCDWPILFHYCLPRYHLVVIFLLCDVWHFMTSLFVIYIVRITNK